MGKMELHIPLADITESQKETNTSLFLFIPKMAKFFDKIS
jgi:hypothetical protein